MQTVVLPAQGWREAWRTAARALASNGVRPEDVAWETGAGLFGGDPLPPPRPIGVPRGFVELADAVLCHRDPERFALLYRALWRLREDRHLLENPADPLMARLRGLEKAVRRDSHKMRAFVRFRELPPGAVADAGPGGGAVPEDAGRGDGNGGGDGDGGLARRAAAVGIGGGAGGGGGTGGGGGAGGHDGAGDGRPSGGEPFAAARPMPAIPPAAASAATPARRRFAAWFEPEHLILARNAPFFARRFADMDWTILTPDERADFVGGVLTIGPGAPKPDLPDDASEALWTTYFTNIFNPARVKLDAMRSEMPLKYWKNLPETRAIPAMLADAERRVAVMRAAAASPAPDRAAAISDRYRAAMPRPPERIETLEQAGAAALHCTRCDLHCHATQTVWGEGAPDAALMIVGEQPGDQEDLQGRPFVGPAGEVLDAAMQAARLDRRAVWLTNAVKHFKFTPRGKRRIHQTPNQQEVEICRWWLDLETRFVRPRLTMGLGGTAALALTGRKEGITRRRGRVEETPSGPVLLSWHPSYILRVPDPGAAAEARAQLAQDLALAARLIAD